MLVRLSRVLDSLDAPLGHRHLSNVPMIVGNQFSEECLSLIVALLLEHVDLDHRNDVATIFRQAILKLRLVLQHAALVEQVAGIVLHAGNCTPCCPL